MCSVSIVSFYYLSSFSSVSPFLTPTLLCVRFSFRVLSPSFLNFRVQYQRRFYRPCFQFIALASIILLRTRSCPLCFQSFVYSLFHLVSLTQHPNNMSPIMTFLVSGLLSLFRRYVAFILGFLAMSPVPFMASCFSVVGVQVGCCLPLWV